MAASPPAALPPPAVWRTSPAGWTPWRRGACARRCPALQRLWQAEGGSAEQRGQQPGRSDMARPHACLYDGIVLLLLALNIQALHVLCLACHLSSTLLSRPRLLAGWHNTVSAAASEHGTHANAMFLPALAPARAQLLCGGEPLSLEGGGSRAAVQLAHPAAWQHVLAAPGIGRSLSKRQETHQGRSRRTWFFNSCSASWVWASDATPCALYPARSPPCSQPRSCQGRSRSETTRSWRRGSSTS